MENREDFDSITLERFLEIGQACYRFNGIIISAGFDLLRRITPIMRNYKRAIKAQRKFSRHEFISHGKHGLKRPRGKRKA